MLFYCFIYCFLVCLSSKVHQAYFILHVTMNLYMPFELFIPTFDQAGYPLSLYPLDSIPRLLLPLNQVPVVSQQLPLAIAVCVNILVLVFVGPCVIAAIDRKYKHKESRIQHSTPLIQVCIIISIQCRNHCNLCMHKGT